MENHNSHTLLAPATDTEIHSILSRFKSEAKSTTGMATKGISSIKNVITPYLRRIFNGILVNNNCILNEWLEAAVFFIHRKGSRDSPKNYRTINVPNPILKTFMSLIANRISILSEENKLCPTFQFGFRKRRSTLGAASILYEVARKE